MQYKFRCNACLQESDFDIRMSDYDTWKKEAHKCPICGKESCFKRVFEKFEGSIKCGGFGVSSDNNWHNN